MNLLRDWGGRPLPAETETVPQNAKKKGGDGVVPRSHLVLTVTAAELLHRLRIRLHAHPHAYCDVERREGGPTLLHHGQLPRPFHLPARGVGGERGAVFALGFVSATSPVSFFYFYGKPERYDAPGGRSRPVSANRYALCHRKYRDNHAVKFTMRSDTLPSADSQATHSYRKGDRGVFPFLYVRDVFVFFCLCFGENKKQKLFPVEHAPEPGGHVAELHLLELPLGGVL